MKIYCKSSATVFLTRNNKNGSQNKHIDIKYLIVRDHIKKKKELVIKHIKTYFMIADPMTKGLPANIYKSHVENMGLACLLRYSNFVFKIVVSVIECY